MNDWGRDIARLLMLFVLAGVVFGGCGVYGIIWFAEHVNVDVQWQK